MALIFKEIKKKYEILLKIYRLGVIINNEERISKKDLINRAKGM